ncbi:MAG TPA: cytochrome c [Kofleriaceae bacterium]|nr:cytochrome c [Kofleriaceae bacterium]
MRRVRMPVRRAATPALRARWLMLLALSACDWTLHRMQEQPKCKTYGTLDGQQCAALPPEGIVPVDEPPQPPPLTKQLVLRGRDRFDRFCAPCHGVAANGSSYVATAMTLRRPPSLVDPAARSLPDDRILAVIDRGYGVMPSYGAAVPFTDRYAILHYVRVLQQHDAGGIPQQAGATRQEGRP